MLNIFGTIKPPITGYPDGPEGLTALLTNFLRLAFLGAGIFAFINIILAGYQFLSSQGDPKAIGNAWQKIWMSVVGLTVIVASFIIAGIVGFILFGDPLYFLFPKITGPGG